MAKITTSIEGYENMTAEEKLAALEALDIAEPDYTGYVKKDLLDKANSEAAGYKRQLKEKMSQEEQASAQREEEWNAMKAELETLKADKAVSEYTAQFLGIGYDEALAKSTAVALNKGDMATMFANHAKFVATREKNLKTELLKGTPTPPAGDGEKKLTKDDFKNMSLAEKQKFATENPDAYKEVYSIKEE